MIVDVNTHFGTSVARTPDLSLSTLLRELGSHQVAMACTCSLAGTIYEQNVGNQETFAAAQAHPQLLPVATLNPRRHLGWERDLDHALEAGAVAFRFFWQEQGWTLNSKPFQSILRHLAPHGKPVILAAGPWSWGNIGAIAEATADAGLPVILLDVQYSNLAEAVQVMQAFPHLLTDTHRLASPGSVEILAGEVGAERLLFGSGAPFRPIQPALNMVLAADLPQADKVAILAGNARRILNLSPAGASSPLPPPRYPAGPIVDVHTHISNWNLPVEATGTEEDLVRPMAACGIEKVVCSHGLAIMYDMGEGNRLLSEAMQRSGSIRGYIVNNANHLLASRQELERYQRDSHFVGVKVHGQMSQVPTGAPAMAELFKAIAGWGRPVLIHNWGEDWPGAIRDLAQTHPRLPIIVAHAFEHTLVPIYRVLDAVAERPNVYLEFGHTFPERHALRLTLDTVGPERVLFGSDQNLIEPRYVLGTYWDANLTATERPLVMRENAQRIFDLAS